MTGISQTPTTFRTSDGAVLSGTWFAPDAPTTCVVISGAVGVPERFYARFAQWLAQERGFAVLTYTYRDMDDTSPKALRKSHVRLEDWAITDGQAARDAALAAYPDLPLWVVGHSLGGMMLSKQPRLDGVTRLITVASGLVDHRTHPMPYRILVWLFWFVLGPMTTSLLGYLPGKTLGLGATLPAGVFWQWRDWCTSGPPGFLARDDLPRSEWARSGAPVKIIGITDDQICPLVCALKLAQAYDGADVTKVTLDPAEHSAPSLGHFALFQDQGRPWWPSLIA